MGKEIAVSQAPNVQTSEPASLNLFDVVARNLYPGARPESVAMVLSYCAQAKLDPMAKPVHIVPMQVKMPDGKYIWRDVIMPGIATYRVMAARSHEYVGKTEPEFGPDITLKLGPENVEVIVPEWCKITVYRMIGQHLAAFTAKEYWVENYATAGRDTTYPNAMWKRRPRGQLSKCSEAQALRMAFPEFVGAAETAEEMEGKVIGSEDLGSETAGALAKEGATAALDRTMGDGSARGQKTAPAAKSGPPDGNEAANGPRGDRQSSHSGLPVAADSTGRPGADDGDADPAYESEDAAEMPTEVFQAYSNTGKWMSAWKWLNETLHTLPEPARTATVVKYANILKAVENYSDKYATAVREMLEALDVDVKI